jgi:ankyrin repeat protein
VGVAEIIKPHLEKDRIAQDCNRSLLAAARDGRSTMIEWLFENGANDPNITDVIGRTPLRTAEEKGYKEVILLLKKYGAK